MSEGLKQASRIVVGYALGLLASVIVYISPLITLDFGNIRRIVFAVGGLKIVGVMLVAIGVFSVIPAIIVIAVGETHGWRKWWIYVGFASVTALALLLMIGFSDWAKVELPFMAASMGASGGFVYWLIAGRHAGLWRKPLA